MTDLEIKAGQVWESRDYRDAGRRVLLVSRPYAQVRRGLVVGVENARTGRQGSIRLRTLLSKFRLVEEPKP